MGIDYFLADPVRQEVKYIDRAGTCFVCCVHYPERQMVYGWPHGPVRLISAECLAEAMDEADPRVLEALEWCQGRSVILLVDDSSSDDERSHDFCHEIVFGEWKGEDWGNRKEWKGEDWGNRKDRTK